MQNEGYLIAPIYCMCGQDRRTFQERTKRHFKRGQIVLQGILNIIILKIIILKISLSVRGRTGRRTSFFRTDKKSERGRDIRKRYRITSKKSPCHKGRDE